MATTLASDNLGVREELAHIYNEMGNTYLKSDQADKAEEMYIKAVKLYHELKQDAGSVSSHPILLLS